MPTKGVVRVPEGTDAKGKMGISGPNVPVPSVPTLPPGYKGGK